MRRSEEQVIQDLQAKIAEIKARADRKRVKRDPALKHISAAMRSIDKAMASTGDQATRQAMGEARTTLSACLSLNGVSSKGGNGVLIPRPRRSARVDETTLLDYVRRNPGQRGEHISAALGTDSKAMRPAMHRLIGEKKVKTKGERRAMVYWPV